MLMQNFGGTTKSINLVPRVLSYRARRREPWERGCKEYYVIFEKGLLKGQNNVYDRQEEIFMLFKSVKYPESILVVFELTRI